MTDRATAKKIIEELEAVRGRSERPEPPPELREALLREVPPELELSDELADDGAGDGGRRVRWALAVAASLVVAVGAGVVAVRVLEEAPAPVAEPPTETVSVSGAHQPGTPPSEETSGDADAAEWTGERVEHVEVESPSTAGVAPEPVEDAAAEPPEPETTAEGGLRLRVTDTEGQPLPGARVEVSDLVAATRTAFTDARGEAKLEGLPPGRYDLEAALEGFSTVEHQEVPVSGERDTAVDVALSPAVEEVLTVTAESPPLPSSSVAVSVKRRPVAFPGLMPPSTGGTAEPNDQPYGDVFFRAYGTNPFIDTEDDPLSTFGLDVDTGSYGVVRRYLSDGHLPPPEAVRVEELVNAFDYGDPAPERSDFRLGAEGARSPFPPTTPAGEAAERYHLVRFSIRARDVAAADRKPAVLTFVVDVSGSMGYENRLALVKRALGLLLDELRPDDRVGLVVYGDRGRVVLPHTGDLRAIRRAVEGLRAEGSTNAEEGLVLGYELARQGFREGALNRVILCSDGVANAGATGPESILERIGEEARRGVELTTVGFGMGNYNDVLMEQLADRGDGAYAYVDTLAEARRVFVEHLTGTLQTVARDAKVQVAFDPETVSRYRLLGYENRDVADERFRDDTVDAGEVGAGHTVTALYEVKLHPGARRRAEAATLTLRYESTETGRVEELSRSITAGELRRGWDEASPPLRLASVVAELAEVLKGSYWAKDADLDELFRRAQAVSAEHPGDLRVVELATLVGKAAALRATP